MKIVNDGKILRELLQVSWSFLPEFYEDDDASRVGL